jgi:hypothetical protein
MIPHGVWVWRKIPHVVQVWEKIRSLCRKWGSPLGPQSPTGLDLEKNLSLRWRTGMGARRFSPNRGGFEESFLLMSGMGISVGPLFSYSFGC